MSKYKMPKREQFSNKGTFGKVLNFCGSDNYIGAAYLTSISSLKTGAGYSALASTPQVINSVSTLLPEAVYLSRKQGLDKIKEFSVITIGCGLGIDEDSKALLEALLNKTDLETPIIIDADALNLIAKYDYKFRLNSIITPHPLEAARLLGVSLNYVLTNLEDTAKALSTKYKTITVLKTHRTIICNTNLETYTNTHGNSALAKAGSGDVLVGIIAGLIAQGLEPYEASKLGVYLHSITGEIASEELTEYSVLASDLPQYLHLAIKKCL